MKIENLIGRKNYEKKLKQNPYEYNYPVSLKTQKSKFLKLLQETNDKKANIYRNNLIPHIYIDKDKKYKRFDPEVRAYTSTNKETGNPEIKNSFTFINKVKNIILDN